MNIKELKIPTWNELLGIEDNVVVIPQKDIVEELRWIRNFFSTTIEQCGVFNSQTEKEREEEKIEYANDTVDDIISELNDFFSDHEINI